MKAAASTVAVAIGSKEEDEDMEINFRTERE